MVRTHSLTCVCTAHQRMQIQSIYFEYRIKKMFMPFRQSINHHLRIKMDSFYSIVFFVRARATRARACSNVWLPFFLLSYICYVYKIITRHDAKNRTHHHIHTYKNFYRKEKYSHRNKQNARVKNQFKLFIFENKDNLAPNISMRFWLWVRFCARVYIFIVKPHLYLFYICTSKIKNMLRVYIKQVWEQSWAKYF